MGNSVRSVDEEISRVGLAGVELLDFEWRYEAGYVCGQVRLQGTNIELIPISRRLMSESILVDAASRLTITVHCAESTNPVYSFYISDAPLPRSALSTTA